MVENTCKLFWSPILHVTAAFWLLHSWLFIRWNEMFLLPGSSCHSRVWFIFSPKTFTIFFSEMAQTWVFFTGFCGFQSCLRSPATFVFGKVSGLALLPASIPHPIPLIWFPNLGNFHQFYNLTELPKILLPAMLAFFFLDAFCYVVCLVVRFKSRTA